VSRLAPVFAWFAAALALAAVAAWPRYVDGGVRSARAAALPTPAPVTADYADRDKEIAFWERAAAEHHRGDMLTPATLSGLYLQRFRERGDLGDVVRAQHEAELALRAQPYGNLSGEVALASAYLTLHRFRDALAVTKYAERFDPGDDAMAIREASIDLELGDYAAAGTIVERLRRQPERPGRGGGALAADTLIARYDELTGHLARARERFERTVAFAQAQFDASAQQRAWFFVRAGELAFESGDDEGALADERRALAVFPNYSEANRMLARINCARHEWQPCLDAARASAQVVPYPEVLGYEVDAQRALGDAAGAARTDDLIRTVERIGNAQHVSDRLLAIYYAEHGERLDDAYRIARRELAVRDDVFTEDTLAWAAAASRRWAEARAHVRRALRYDTENALLQYHAGAIAAHFGDRGEAARRLARALALNPRFHAVYADDARARLAALSAHR
jgi:tetratricopeptide (TPR) repeat protein